MGMIDDACFYGGGALIGVGAVTNTKNPSASWFNPGGFPAGAATGFGALLLGTGTALKIQQATDKKLAPRVFFLLFLNALLLL